MRELNRRIRGNHSNGLVSHQGNQELAYAIDVVQASLVPFLCTDGLRHPPELGGCQIPGNIWEERNIFSTIHRNQKKFERLLPSATTCCLQSATEQVFWWKSQFS